MAAIRLQKYVEKWLKPKQLRKKTMEIAVITLCLQEKHCTQLLADVALLLTNFVS